VVANSTGNIVLVDSKGAHLGYLTHGFTAKDIADAKARLAAPGPRYTTEQVLAKLQVLGGK
jgi:hypothetical protein